MGFLNWMLDFFKSFVGAPSLFIGFVVMLGCLIEKRRFSDVITSTIKASVAFLVIQGGGLLISQALTLFTPVFNNLFGMSGAALSNEGTFAEFARAIPSLVSMGAMIMVIAMFINILFAKITRFKFVYLSGHILLFMGVCFAIVFNNLILTIDTTMGYAFCLITSSLLLGIYMILAPALIQPWVKTVTNSDELAIAHAGTVGYFISGMIGSLIGKIKKGNVRSTESIKFPKGLSFFRNTTVSVSVFMMIFFLVIFIPQGIIYEINGQQLDNAVVEAIMRSGSLNVNSLTTQNWLITGFLESLRFGAGIFIILTGVNSLIGELVPAFRGISDKLIKNAKAALDIPVLFPFAPNAVLIGFVSCFFGALTAMGITIGIGVSSSGASYIILPAVMSVFFQGAGAGVIGNSKGGVLGAIFGAFITGMLFTLFPLIYINTGWYNAEGVDPEIVNSLGWASTDFVLGVIPMLFGFIGNKTLGASLYLTFLLAIVAILVIDGIFWNIKQKNSLLLKDLYSSQGKELPVFKELIDKEENKIAKKEFKLSLKKEIKEYKESLAKNKAENKIST